MLVVVIVGVNLPCTAEFPRTRVCVGVCVCECWAHCHLSFSHKNTGILTGKSAIFTILCVIIYSISPLFVYFKLHLRITYAFYFDYNF